MLSLQSNQPKNMQEQLVTLLKQQFGAEVTADAVKSVANQLNTTYATEIGRAHV